MQYKDIKWPWFGILGSMILEWELSGMQYEYRNKLFAIVAKTLRGQHRAQRCHYRIREQKSHGFFSPNVQYFLLTFNDPVTIGCCRMHPSFGTIFHNQAYLCLQAGTGQGQYTEQQGWLFSGCLTHFGQQQTTSSTKAFTVCSWMVHRRPDS